MTAIAGVILLITDGWFVYVHHGVVDASTGIASSVAALIGGMLVGSSLNG